MRGRSPMTLRRPLVLCLIFAACLWSVVFASPASPGEAMGIALEGFPYPYPVDFMPVTLEGEDLRFAYMDVPPDGPATGRTVVLLHGRNFPPAIGSRRSRRWLRPAIGSWPRIKSALANRPSPDSPIASTRWRARRSRCSIVFGVDRFDLVGHSMGGMLAVRLARAYGSRIDHLVLYSPIGLEDYRFYVPPVTDEELAGRERALTADAYRKQLMTNYALSLPSSCDRAVRPVARKDQGERRISALAEVVRGVLPDDLHPAGRARDPAHRPADPVHHGRQRPQRAGAAFAPPELRDKMGQNAALAQSLAARMSNAKAVVFEGVGHLGHLEATQSFNETLLNFLRQ